MRFQRQISAVLVISLALFHCAAIAGDLPPKLEQDLARAKETFSNEYKAANDALSEAFDKGIENLRKSSKLSGDSLVKAIETLETEKVRFEKHGRVPMSQPMRGATVLYLKRIQRAENALANVYKPAIEHHTKKKADDEAKILLADKEAVIAPKTVIVLKRLDHGFVWELKSDGSGGSRTWSIDSKSLVVTYRDAKLPDRKFTYTCVVHANGTDFDCVDETGGKFRATLVEPE